MWRASQTQRFCGLQFPFPEQILPLYNPRGHEAPHSRTTATAPQSAANSHLLARGKRMLHLEVLQLDVQTTTLCTSSSNCNRYRFSLA